MKSSVDAIKEFLEYMCMVKTRVNITTEYPDNTYVYFLTYAIKLPSKSDNMYTFIEYAGIIPTDFGNKKHKQFIHHKGSLEDCFKSLTSLEAERLGMY